MKLIVTQTFEQGLSRADGGAIKLLAGEYEAKDTKHGIVVSIRGVDRTLPTEIAAKLKAAGLIAVG